MVSPVIFDFYDYLKNPIADFCVSQYKSKTVYTLDDLLPEIQNLKHSKWALENDLRSYIGDQLRLKLATEKDDFLYIDADVYVPDMDIILSNKNCTDFVPGKNIINNGTFFYTDKDCRFNSFYLEIYDNLDVKDYRLCNYGVFKKYPFELDFKGRKSGDMKLLDNNNTKHFLINIFYRFLKKYGNVDTIYYTKKSNVEMPYVWQIEQCYQYVAYRKYFKNNQPNTTWYFETLYKYLSQDDLIRLFKEQLRFTFQKDLKFIEI